MRCNVSVLWGARPACSLAIQPSLTTRSRTRRRELGSRATYIDVGNISAATEKVKGGLLVISNRSIVGQQPRVEYPNGRNPRIRRLGIRLDAATALARSRNATRVNGGVGALPGIRDGPVDGVGHPLRRRLARAIGRAVSDDKVAERGDLGEEALKEAALGGAAAVAPH